MTKNYVCSTPYIMKHTSYDHEFWYTCVKWWLLYFQDFDISFSGLLGGGEVKGQKMAQNDNITKNSVCLTLYLRSCTSYDCGFWYTYFEWLYLQQYFHFFQNSVFLWVLGGKRAKHDWYFSILVCHILYLQNCRSCHQDHWCTVIK